MTTGCARCGAHASFIAHPLEVAFCEPCHTAWIREPTCSMEAVCIAAGLAVVYSHHGTSYQDRTEKFAAELLKRTQEWIAKGTA